MPQRVRGARVKTDLTSYTRVPPSGRGLSLSLSEAFLSRLRFFSSRPRLRRRFLVSKRAKRDEGCNSGVLRVAQAAARSFAPSPCDAELLPPGPPIRRPGHPSPARRGYMAAEYAMRGYLTYKADVYSFGVVILEIVSGKSNTNYWPKEDLFYLLDWAYVLQEQGSLLDLVDPSLGTNYSKEEAQQMLNLALVCTSPSPTLRPPMSIVVSMLEGQTPVQVPTVQHIQQGSEEMRLESFERISHDSQKQSISMDGPCVVSSVSISSCKGDSTYLSSTSKLLSDYTD